MHTSIICVHVHVFCGYRTHLSIEGGGRLLQRAIRGLAPKHRSERQRRGGREERGKREGAGGGGKKRKLHDTQGEP